ncbi:hypothetical protein WCD99_00580 [Pseudomonas paraeruginosa]|uniref:hypothetical protein n=1 Tax=Pseudomonas aeruginosa group TaxID=136841 RepID=UPI001EDD833C|nr:hypothetical protein [Pseudomonas aeruginosa]MCR3763873.1 hypothetical protein [Pseudomonas aeruginosa]MCT5138864.1 hypothetical protein [Pseudomonas aeruginosa]MDP5672103.1 hypothetical protein [Pseudomonas aeruginosa]
MEYLTHIFTFIAGLGAGWTLKVIISNKTLNLSRKTVTRQENNNVGGDMAGGDIHKK